MFRDRLRELRRKQLEKRQEEERARKAQQEEQSRQAKLEQEREAEEKKRLEQLARAKLLPILELVNKEYLRDRGSISIEGRVIDLGWGEWKKDFGTYLGGNSLELCLRGEAENLIEVRAAHEWQQAVSLEDHDWQAKVEDAVYSILSTPEKCEWRYNIPQDVEGLD